MQSSAESTTEDDRSSTRKYRVKKVRKQSSLLFLSPYIKLSTREILTIFFFIFGGCCSNVFALELITSQSPKSTTLITFCQFLFVSIEGLTTGGMLHISPIIHPSLKGYISKEFLPRRSSFFPYRIRLQQNVIPIYHWVVMVVLFWTLSVLNNIALDYKIDMPLHIVFKSAGLMLNMMLGWLLMHKKYSMMQIISVSMVSLGVIVSTFASASDIKHSIKQNSSLTEWLTGIAFLSTALIMSSVLGLYQERTYKRYGKQWKEGLFYTHFLAVPFFVFLLKDLREQAILMSQSPPITLPFILHFCLPFLKEEWLSLLSFIQMPKLWFFILLNAFTQFICISGVHQLTSVSTSLTVNLVLTMRKFLSLLLSIFYFGSTFTTGHWIGTILAFLGTFIYSFHTALSSSYFSEEKRRRSSVLVKKKE